VLKILIEYGRDGAVPGVIAEELGIPANTLSFHLSHMTRAGLVTSKKSGRSISYFDNSHLIEELIGYLRANCCAREKKVKSKAKKCHKKKCHERKC
jgi:DNA-binding transcriptional ArsR family regulator